MVDRQAELVSRFRALGDWEERYRAIIELGRELPPYPEAKRIELHKVKGCQSQVWLVATPIDGRIRFEADSDASIVRGLIALLVHVYSDRTPDEILGTPATFIDELGLSQHLSQSRANGLSAMLKQIKLYAAAIKATRR